jgi:hypothetical protein
MTIAQFCVCVEVARSIENLRVGAKDLRSWFRFRTLKADQPQGYNASHVRPGATQVGNQPGRLRFADRHTSIGAQGIK